nr:early activation antigen CD69 isoform X3 [Saimiri boliviensis boliviensis]
MGAHLLVSSLGGSSRFQSATAPLKSCQASSNSGMSWTEPPGAMKTSLPLPLPWNHPCCPQINEGAETLSLLSTPPEFLKRFAGTDMHWIGLSRKPEDSWKWTNGTTFNNWFEITGNGFYAFLNVDGVYSSRGLIDIKWICSKPHLKCSSNMTDK